MGSDSYNMPYGFEQRFAKICKLLGNAPPIGIFLLVTLATKEIFHNSFFQIAFSQWHVRFEVD